MTDMQVFVLLWAYLMGMSLSLGRVVVNRGNGDCSKMVSEIASVLLWFPLCVYWLYCRFLKLLDTK